MRNEKAPTFALNFALALALVLGTGAAHAQEPILPPVEYDHPFDGVTMVQRIETQREMFQVCPNPKNYPELFGCSWQLHRGCLVIMVPDKVIKARGVDPDHVRRHVIGHCNGWPADHPGARNAAK